MDRLNEVKGRSGSADFIGFGEDFIKELAQAQSGGFVSNF
jgi:hypothetical protein